MKIEIQSKPLQGEYITLELGKRSFLHPKLKIIDMFDCQIVYNIPNKFFIVDYKKEGQIYTKTLLTTSVEFIIEVLLEK